MKAVDQRRGKDVDETELKMKQTGGLAMGKKLKLPVYNTQVLIYKPFPIKKILTFFANNNHACVKYYIFVKVRISINKYCLF